MNVTTVSAAWNRWTLAAVALLAVGIGAAALACGESPKLVQDAVGEDPAAAKAAVAALRAQGPAGLTRLMRARAEERAAVQMKCAAETPQEQARAKRFEAVIDAVAAQKDASASGLYWYTDLEQAKAAAAREGKPILSLRLLGNLDSEFSCANSRFFRTVLYADEAVSQGAARALRAALEVGAAGAEGDDRHGRRPHDLPDGHRQQHPLRAGRAGRVVDALPGLYGAKAFLARARRRRARGTARVEYAPGRRDAAASLAQWHGDARRGDRGRRGRAT
jgi:hypothetical protein